MAAQLKKRERELYEQVIENTLQKNSNISSLRITWDLRTKFGQGRHTLHQMVKFVRKIIKVKGYRK